jgi:hypothetical protein
VTVEARRPGPSKQKSRIALWTYNLAKPGSLFVCFGQHINKPKSVTSRFDSLSEHTAAKEDLTKRKHYQPYRSRSARPVPRGSACGMQRLPHYPERRFTLSNGILVIRQHPSNRRASHEDE